MVSYTTISPLPSKLGGIFLLPFSPKDYSLPTLVGTYLDMFETDTKSGLSSSTLNEQMQPSNSTYTPILYYFSLFLTMYLITRTMTTTGVPNTTIHIKAEPKPLRTLTNALNAFFSTPNGLHLSSSITAPTLL